jgi:hypothetical protein
MADQSFGQQIGALLDDAFVNQLVVGDVEGKKSSVRGILAMTKVGATLPVSSEQLADARDMQTSLRRWMDATPEEREAWAEQSRRERAEKRAAVVRRELTVDALIDKMMWSREYAEHLVQPYCECYDGMDGWEYCEHARDEGVTP